MKRTIRASIVYFVLIMIYKLFGYTGDNEVIRHYWINYYWFVSSIYFMLVFIDVKKYCIDLVYKRIAGVIVFYWLVMALLRLFLFFAIKFYKPLTNTGGKLTVGAVIILLSFIYLTAKLWHQKYLTE